MQLTAARTTCAQPLPAAERASIRDFVEYWSAARLFVQNGNPYAPDELLILQRSAGWRGVQPLVMWNPPWVLPFVVPFGLLSFTTGQFLPDIDLCSTPLANLQHLRPTLPPSLTGSTDLCAGSLCPYHRANYPLVLAGLTWFLYSERNQNDWTMSASLVVLSIKPHLLYLFWIIFLLWVFDKRPWRLILLGTLLGLDAVTLPVVFDTRIYSEYLGLYGVTGISKPMDWPAPTLRNVIRILFGANQTWLQFAPTVIAVVWAIYYWEHHKHQWRWQEQLPLLSMMSVTSSLFVWTYDHVVLLPAILEAAAWMIRSPDPWYRYWASRVYLAINACHFLSRFWLAEELWYFWLAPALLFNYWLFCWERRRGLDSPGQ